MPNAKLSLSLLVIIIANPIQAQDFTSLVSALRGAKLIAQDDKYTSGTFENAYSSDSLFNEYSSYGNNIQQHLFGMSIVLLEELFFI